MQRPGRRSRDSIDTAEQDVTTGTKPPDGQWQIRQTGRIERVKARRHPVAARLRWRRGDLSRELEECQTGIWLRRLTGLADSVSGGKGRGGAGRKRRHVVSRPGRTVPEIGASSAVKSGRFFVWPIYPVPSELDAEEICTLFAHFSN